uniref:Solute-binding protein family 3/N-terminal domain-containing protein n=1 Tax=Plectus sambesii TaxID=2011161 RepID=A0A914XBY8_9BILA
MLKKLRVVAYDIGPSVMLERCLKRFGRPCKRPGSDVELAQLAFSIAGFEYEIVKNLNVEPSNILQLIHNGTADMSVLTMRMTEDRMKLVDFSFPISYYYNGYRLKEVDGIEDVYYIFRSFQPAVWAVLAAVLFLITTLQILYNKHRWSLGETLWKIITTMLHQDYPSSSKRLTPSGIIQGSWLLACLILVINYESVMKSFLAVPLRHKVPFQTLAELLDLMESGSYKAVQFPNGNRPVCCQDECDRVRRMEKMGRIINTDIKKVTSHIKSGKIVNWGGYEPDLYPHDVNVWNKSFLFIKDTKLLPELLGFAFSKDLIRERQKFNNALQVVIPGIANIRGRYATPMPEYNRMIPLNSGKITMTMIHLDNVLIFYICGVTLALAVFLLEYMLVVNTVRDFYSVFLYRL